MGKSINIVITGCRGQLGFDLMSGLSAKYDVYGFDIGEVDITRPDDVMAYMREVRPRVVIHAAALTDVDGCQKDPRKAMLINGDGTHNVALACRDIGARMIYYSTDYVFDGMTKDKKPYTEDDTASPQTVYGKSKLAGERWTAETLDDFFILRIAWLYGRRGKNFAKTMIDLGRDQINNKKAGNKWRPLKVVNDQYGNPTYTMDVVRQTIGVMGSDLTGIAHAASEGVCSWYEFAGEIFNKMELNVEIEPCSTSEFPRPAPRPHWSALENKRLKDCGLNLMRDWREALTEFTTELKGREVNEV